MGTQTQWFFSWNAYDASTWEHLPQYSFGEVYVCDGGKTGDEIFVELMAEKRKMKDNLWIQCIAFNKL
ncbi:hypothetical protein [Atlantibacter hermannii]|uniref:hypothetical protein n=1 Tax=Atlantibacter hermannii TaxID=565 RepID=UPI00289A6974|nr:hypothetical protein [Atlantibacter hermannii]